MVEKFLIYFPDPFGIGASQYAIATPEGVAFVEAGAVAEIDIDLITYDAASLIEDLRRSNAKLPAKLIDIGEAIRLATGLSKSDGGEQKWSFWRNIRRHFNADSDWRLAQAIHESRADRPDKIELIRLCGSIAVAVISLWNATKVELRETGEEARFFKIEVPTARIFYLRQYNGIAVDLGSIESCLQEASRAKYDAYQKVADQIEVSPTGLHYWNISRYLSLTDASHLADVVQGYSLRDQLKMSRDISKFAAFFSEFMDAARDVDVLTRLSNANGRTYPTFHPIGTISSRILVSDPYLQGLRRKYRKVLIADPDHSTIYFDYSQFEPGIMASLASDAELIRMYNEGDIYSALSSALFGSADHRDVCKRIFLSFSYGMTLKGISNLLTGAEADVSARSDAEEKVKAFFDKFGRLAQFKIELEGNLLNNGYTATHVGNRRVRKRPGRLSPRERRWAVSQAIQGNASLIFKRAIIALAHAFGPDAILLPMHDAVLMQFSNKSNVDENVRRVTAIMRDAFASVCPFVDARISVSTFT